MSRFETQRVYLEANRKTGRKAVGSDVTMVIHGYEDLTFLLKTNGLPMLKNDKAVEYTSAHGVENSEDGYLQTLNKIQVTFMENDALRVKNAIEQIQLEDKNGELKIDFFVGRTLESNIHWGTMEFCNIVIADNPEGDVEATTTPMTISATINGHYFPSETGGTISDIQTLLNLVVR